MTTPPTPPNDSDSRWVDGTLEAGADAESSDERSGGDKGTGVEIGRGKPSTFEPEEEIPPSLSEQ